MSMDIQQDIYYVSRAQYLNLYHCKSKFVLPWSQYSGNLQVAQVTTDYPKNQSLNEKVSVFAGDITALEVDAIVNSANTSLIRGGGVDGAIHRAAGPELQAECMTLDGCPTGEAKITGGYKLPAKYVIHTVGPHGEKSELLQNCYQYSLNVAKENGVRTIAFPCISTGIHGYPNENAAHIALRTIRRFLERNERYFDKVIFCLYLPADVAIYENLLQEYFPI